MHRDLQNSKARQLEQAKNKILDYMRGPHSDRVHYREIGEATGLGPVLLRLALAQLEHEYPLPTEPFDQVEQAFYEDPEHPGYWRFEEVRHVIPANEHSPLQDE